MVSSASLSIPQNPFYPEGHVLLHITSLHVPVSVDACFTELSVNCQVLPLASWQPKHLQALPLLPAQGTVQQGDAQGAGAGPLCDARDSTGAASEPLRFLRVIRPVLPNCWGESPASLFPQSFPPCSADTLVHPQDTTHQSGLPVTPVCWLIFALPDSKNFALCLIKGSLPGSVLARLESQVYSHRSLALASSLFASWKQKYRHPLVKDNKPNRICSLASKQGSISGR